MEMEIQRGLPPIDNFAVTETKTKKKKKKKKKRQKERKKENAVFFEADRCTDST
jgi:hypothetical protein